MSPRILLVQARVPNDPMLVHELECFAAQSQLPREAFVARNLTEEGVGLDVGAWLGGVDGVMIGGSGDFSVVEGGFAWHEPMLELMRALVARRVPTFGSCFGHQALVQALGGELVREPARGEVGTFRIELTEAGQGDPLFGGLPPAFDAQLGHLDRAVRLPEGVRNLAFSDLCEVQAIRVEGTPVVATQFHPELTRDANLERWLRYIAHYKGAGESLDEARARAQACCRPSPHASSLLARFVRAELGG